MPLDEAKREFIDQGDEQGNYDPETAEWIERVFPDEVQAIVAVLRD